MTKADDIRVRQCNIRLVRKAEHGAQWLDRDQHRDLARRMQPALLDLLEKMLMPQLTEALPNGCARPLKFEVTLPSPELSARGAIERVSVKTAISDAIGKGLASLAEETTDADPAPRNHREKTPPLPPTRPTDPRDYGSVIPDLVELQRVKALRRFLHHASNSALLKILQRLNSELQGATTKAEPESTVPTDIRPGDAEHADLRGAVQEAIRELAELLARGSRFSGSADRQKALGSQVANLPNLIRQLKQVTEAENVPSGQLKEGQTKDPPDTSQDIEADVAQNAQSASIEHGPAHRSALASRSEFLEGRFEVECALPFVVLAQLARHGAFALLDADTAATGLAFATALKSHPAPPPKRPWPTSAQHCAALAAGLHDPLKGEDLVDTSRNGAAIFDLARAAINAAIAPGLVDLGAQIGVYDAGRFVLFDPVGQFPAGLLRADELEELVPVRASAIVLPPNEIEGLDRLRNAGIAAVCEGTPARGETFVTTTSHGGWQGIASAASERFDPWRSRLPYLTQAAAAANAMWSEMRQARPLCAGDADALDQTAALLATFGLSEIAYRLSLKDDESWREPNPLLALERFADLPARIDISPEDFCVTLPLGRRFSDLSASGLLDPAPGLPWLEGRRLRVQGG